MCGIVGYKVMKGGDVSLAIPLFEELLKQSQIRGKHATGVAWVKNEKVRTAREPVPAQQFLSGAKWAEVKNQYKPLCLIAHCRYSTSGKCDQPVIIPGRALVHNGLFSMANKEVYEKQFDVSCETGNDSEIVLRLMETNEQDQAFEAMHGEYSPQDAFASSIRQLFKRGTPIYAMATVDFTGTVMLTRDHIRPLWFFYIKEWSLLGFASTQDIIKRAFKKFKDMPEAAIWEAEPYNIYTMTDKGFKIYNYFEMIPRDLRLRMCFPQSVKPRTTKPLTNTKLLSNAEHTLRGKDLALVSPTLIDGDHRTNYRESFKRYAAASVATNEIDPNYPLMQYLFQRYELSESQQYWACWLYGVFYHPGTVFYVMQEFPEYELVDINRLRDWHTRNWKSLRYNKDRKYEKGHFVEMFLSYREVIGGQTPTAQRDYFEQSFIGTPYENFHHLWKRLNALVRFGRYSLYIYTETLARCMGVPIEANTVFLKDSASPRAGLCHVVGKPEWAKAKLATDDWTYLETEVHKLIGEINREYPTVRMDYWFMESCLCAYKGFFANGRYLGYYLDRMADEITQMADESITSGVEWTVLWQFRKESFPWEYLGEYANPPRMKIVANWRKTLVETGQMIGYWPMVKRGLLPNTPVGRG